MSWTNGTWADVSVGDTVLGGDGYPWSVTDEEPRYAPNGDEYVNATIEREGRAPANATMRASKPVKYRKAEPVVTEMEPADVDGTCVCGPLQYCHRDDCHGGEADPAPVTLANGVKLETGTPAAPKVAPYVEYDESERAAASALKGAGLTMTVIERVMTLDGLLEHLDQIHHVDLPQTGTLTRIEYRSRLADLHFELHAHDQERGQKWAPRGRTPHVHPVMDRPMEDATPKSLRRR